MKLFTNTGRIAEYEQLEAEKASFLQDAKLEPE